MADLFDVVGVNFFKPLTSIFKSIYWQCLQIIYDSYRTELSYGIEREPLVQKLTYYFDDLKISDIQFEDETDIISDSRDKASSFLRKLIEYGWIAYETGLDQRTRVVMPSHAVSVIRSLQAVSSGKETEYQSEISTIYSLLVNPELMSDPYPQVIKPVYDRTIDLFTALKQLNTDIKKYLDNLTADKTAEEIIANYFTYSTEIGTKAYHRLYTSENVARYRNMILVKIDDIRRDREVFQKTAWGYQKIEGVSDLDAAEDETRRVINDIVEYFNSYDNIVKEIEKKHALYLDGTVKRARFLLMNTNNIEGKVNAVLRYMAEACSRDEEANLEEDVPEEICSLFNIFTQGFIGSDSIKTSPAVRKITVVEDIYRPVQMSDEERAAIRIAAFEKNKNRFTRKNIEKYVAELLQGKSSMLASEIDITSRRDMIRLIFISLYGQTGFSNYSVASTDNKIEKQGFSYMDFEIRRKKNAREQ